MAEENTNTEFKLSYNSSRLRVRVAFKARLVFKYDQPPDDLLQRAQAKLQSEKEKGSIAFYLIFADKFHEVWQKIKKEISSEEEKEQVINFTLAAGSPSLEGLTVNKSSDPKIAYELSFNTTSDIISKWRFDWVKVAISYYAKQAGIKHKGNSAQINGAWIRACNNIKVKNLAISHSPPVDHNAKPFVLLLNKGRLELTLVIYNPKIFKGDNQSIKIINIINQYITKIKSSYNIEMTMLKNELIDNFKSAANGREIFGIDLPVTFLAAIGLDQQAAISFNEQSNKQQEKQEEKQYPGKGLLKVRIENNNMEAVIDNFNVDLYNDDSFDVSVDWIKLELERLNITYGINDELIHALEEAISKQENLSDMLVASGDPPKGGADPYLYNTYQDSKLATEEMVDHTVDLRDLQQRKIVQSGNVIAEICYAKPPEPGIDIYGNNVEPTQNEELDITIGEGVKKKGQNKFIAKIDGIPVIEDNAISLNQILTHEGDVNLRTGNIRFDGPVDITGSIDSGSLVDVTGDLSVTGTIRGAFVRVAGSLTAKAGIVTGNMGIINVKGDLNAEFIENSTIICGGNIVVKKAILNCNVVCGGSIQVSDQSEGIIAGGTIACKNIIKTTKLGFPNGAITNIRAGVDWKIERAIQIRTKRLDKVVAQNTNDRNALREITRKNSSQRTKKHEEMKVRLQKRLTKSRLLIEKLKEHLESARALMSYNSESKIYVYDVLSTNVSVEVAGIKVAITHDVAEVQITPRRSHGSYIQPITKEKNENQDKTAS